GNAGSAGSPGNAGSAGSPGNAGAAGSPGNPGSNASCVTYNAISVTSGASYPINMGGPGATITISWGEQ
ncbi:MAG: hypothetical protein EB127_19035, partial [Alphaproteobacteria bacterium]|nr:hypothetical protein [Alphaproteobacteria bacterium]